MKQIMNPGIKLLYCILLSINIISHSNISNAEEKSMPIVQQIYVEGEAEGTDAEIRVNDIPLIHLTADSGVKSAHTEINLLSGENTLSIIPAQKTGAVSARLVSYRLDEFVDGKGGETLLVAVAENGKTAIEKMELPPGRPVWDWLGADNVAGEAGYQEALAFAKSFYEALRKGDAEKVEIALLPLHTDYTKQSPDFSVEARNKESKEGMEEIVNDPIWQWDDINDVDFEVVPVANGRLYDIRRKDGTTLFRTNQINWYDRYKFYNMIGRKNGIWQFYR